MSRKAKPRSMMELCEIFQARKARIFGDRTPPGHQESPKDDCTPSSKKHEEQPNVPCIFPASKNHQKQPQQANRVTVARQTDTKEKTGWNEGVVSNNKTIIRRPLARVIIAVHRTRCDLVPQQQKARDDNMKPRSRNVASTLNQAMPEREAHENKQGTEGHQTATKQQQQKARDDNMKPRSRNVASTLNQAMPERRVACQHQTNDAHYTDRRKGVCHVTDPAQQHLTFIRVLRKRF
ncbi:hypothetical protein OS493_039924 [Desmophyllum pertusum]|uniref:Uncharacterized protein n=1 Tax=Desmophyllum pertusum TaxID=174260 RepID=A0A9W9Z7Z8_9CNID|nr:hypothetical protein OS493_039924 [Desmophyllum pertusum]